MTKAALAFAYPEHLGPACGTDALSRRLPILHGYALGILHFPLGAALHTIGLHLLTSLFLL